MILYYYYNELINLNYFHKPCLLVPRLKTSGLEDNYSTLCLLWVRLSLCLYNSTFLYFIFFLALTAAYILQSLVSTNITKVFIFLNDSVKFLPTLWYEWVGGGLRGLCVMWLSVVFYCRTFSRCECSQAWCQRGKKNCHRKRHRDRSNL